MIYDGFLWPHKVAKWAALSRLQLQQISLLESKGVEIRPYGFPTRTVSLREAISGLIIKM